MNREFVRILVRIALLAGGLFALAAVRVVESRAGYRILRLERQLADLQRVEAELRLEAARLASPAQIDRLAREQLGMRSPSFDQIVFPKATR